MSDSASTRADHRYELQGQRKGFKRYYTKESRAFIQRLMAAEDHRDTALKDISRRIFAQFDEHHLLWEKAAGMQINLTSTILNMNISLSD